MGWVIGITLTVIIVSSGFLLYLHLKQRIDTVTAGRRTRDLAMVKLSQQLRKNPNDSGALTKLGIIKLKKGEVKAALADLNRAGEIDPANPETRFHRAMALAEAGDKPAAMKEFRWILDHSEDPYFKTAARDRLDTLRRA